ncbi:MAG: ATP-binding protein [Gammaproteobacteria bacterium]
MSLRHQINLRILFFSICILTLGGSIAIWQARIAVTEEVDSSINMALQLIKLGFSKTPFSGLNESDWLYRLGALKETRHLKIQLRQPSGHLIDIPRNNRRITDHDRPPRWFVNLVVSDYPEAEYQMKTADGKPLTLLIQANPLDEITEVWRETAAFFISITLLVSLTFLVVHLVFEKTLKSIDLIVNGLKQIETGQYRQKLPEFTAREYDSIAKAINHMTEVLYVTQQENRALTQHSLQIQEEERQRLAQELHDELGQSLTAIKVMAVTAAHTTSDLPKITETIAGVCDHLMTVVRSMMHQLHPLILTELGLKAALEDMVNHWSERNPNLMLSLDCDDSTETLDPKIGIQLFRVIQECLTNTVRHAHARQVEISLTRRPENPESLSLRVSDDGVGCAVNRISSGFGLRGMQERIKSLGGDLAVVSEPGRGMTITAAISAP